MSCSASFAAISTVSTGFGSDASSAGSSEVSGPPVVASSCLPVVSALSGTVAAQVSRDKLGERWISDSIGLLANETSVMVRQGLNRSIWMLSRRSVEHLRAAMAAMAALLRAHVRSKASLHTVNNKISLALLCLLN
jgi:hypothetical protein